MSDNPQKQFIEPLPTLRQFDKAEKDDIDDAALYDINEAIQDAEAERRTGPSRANLGYADLKKRR